VGIEWSHGNIMATWVDSRLLPLQLTATSVLQSHVCNVMCKIQSFLRNVNIYWPVKLLDPFCHTPFSIVWVSRSNNARNLCCVAAGDVLLSKWIFCSKHICVWTFTFKQMEYVVCEWFQCSPGVTPVDSTKSFFSRFPSLKLLVAFKTWDYPCSIRISLYAAGKFLVSVVRMVRDAP